MGQFLATEAGFSRFYRANIDALLRFFARRTFDSQAAVDLAAETFAQAFASRRTFRGTLEGEESAWLFAIARRQLARYFEAGNVDQKLSHKLLGGVPVADAADCELIEKMTGLDALRVALRESLEELEPAAREALWLRVVEERPYAGVAAALGISEPAARKRVSRALRVLSASPALADVDYEEGVA